MLRAATSIYSPNFAVWPAKRSVLERAVCHLAVFSDKIIMAFGMFDSLPGVSVVHWWNGFYSKRNIIVKQKFSSYQKGHDRQVIGSGMKWLLHTDWSKLCQ